MKNVRWMVGAVALACGQGCGDDGVGTSVDESTTVGPTVPMPMTTTTEPTTTSLPTEGPSETDPPDETSATESAVTIESSSEDPPTLPTTGTDSDPSDSDPTTETTSDDTTGPMPGCGDGVLDDGEACDDGNADNTDTCLDTCEAASCGDGFVGPGEACDDGNQTNDDDCSNTCALTSCGDGVKQPDEACDDGNQSNTDACLTTCVNASCGDGFVGPGEACDDGNPNNNDSCLNTCVAAKCGDGFVGPGEACDDGNAVNDDMCSNACATAGCGDGVKQMGEQCDDGDEDNTDMCLDTCVNASCGDGYVQAGVEQCDDGNADETDACVGTCKAATCGDGKVQAGVEACDDGNQSNTDACVAMCKAAACGDGFVQAGVEMCDDGNQSNNDACDNTCKPTNGTKQVEAGWYHTCALTFAGKVHCWGRNDFGQLGQGNKVQVGNMMLPNTIPAIDLGGVAVDVTAGENHTCALIDDGSVRCWGYNNVGQLGLGTTTNIGDDEKPSLAPALNIGGQVTQIAAGRNHTCAVLANKKVRCWGAGASGALGYANVQNIGDTELPMSAGDVTIGVDVLQVAAGEQFTCVRTAADNVRCWGLGTGGRLGYANTNAIGDNEFPSVAGDVNFGAKAKFIATGSAHTCVITDTDNVRCWGTVASGQLGYGQTNNNIGDNEFPNVGGNVSLGGDKFVALSLSLSSSCGLTTTGTMRCWGNSTYGQLGQGNVLAIGDNEVPSVIPPIDIGGTATAITADWTQACAALTTGGIRCWGRSNYGQLGYGNLLSVGDNEIPASVGEVQYK